jgi:hypothetical protein
VKNKKFITLSDSDTNRVAVLHDEILERISEIGRIVAPKLGLDLATHYPTFERHEIDIDLSPRPGVSIEERVVLVRVLTNADGTSTGCYLRKTGVITLCGGKPGPSTLKTL